MATLTVTSLAGTPDGFYNVGVSATNASAATSTASTAATYVISTPTPLSINIATNQSSYLPGQTVVASVTVLSGTSPDAGTSVTVQVVSPNGKTTTLSGTTGSNGVASVSYKLSKRAVVGTYGANANMAILGTAGGSATTGARTTFVVQ